MSSGILKKACMDLDIKLQANANSDILKDIDGITVI